MRALTGMFEDMCADNMNTYTQSQYQYEPIAKRLYQALDAGGEKTALVVNKRNYSYSQLRNSVFALAKQLTELQVERLAILAHRSFEVYQSIFASILSGTTYVPLNAIFPEEKSAFILEHSQSSHIFIGPECIAYAIKMFLLHPESLAKSEVRIIMSVSAAMQLQDKLQAQEAKVESLRSLRKLIKSRLITVPDTDLQATLANGDAANFKGLSAQPCHPMHILYTSGTTGQPKGVVISYHNYSCYFTSLMGMYDFKSSDVFSHFAELTFDISLQDPLLALVFGGTVVCPSKIDLLTPNKYINQAGITIIQTVPSLISYMLKAKILEKEHNDKVRLTFFIGEALWYHLLQSYHRAYPQSRLINTYGPTETTVWASHYEVDTQTLESMDSTNSSIVPLGRPFGCNIFKVCDEQGNEVPEGTTGELYIGGEQLAQGYYHNELKTKEAFVSLHGEPFYRTGDLVSAFNEHATQDGFHAKAGESFTNYHYIGRQGDMIKVHGYRVSVYEIEEQMGKLTTVPLKVLAATLCDKGINETVIIAAFECDDDSEINKLKPLLNGKMSFYMQPKFMVATPIFPLNANGKVDRKLLTAQVIEHLSATKQVHFLP